METETETQVKDSLHHGQLILVTRKDTTRLLEVYVKRSLSVNDASPSVQRRERRKKWVTMPERHKRVRRSSSDPSTHLTSFPTEDLDTFAAVETPPTSQSETDPEPEVKKKSKKKKKKKEKERQKPSLWKRFLGLFSEKEEEPASGPELPDVTAMPSSDSTEANGLPQPGTSDSPRRRKSIRRRFSKKRKSLRKSVKQTPITEIGLVSVEPTYSYYEKVSEEMQKIVHEVKEKEVLSDEEVIKRIIALTKIEGDAIDDKLKDNPTLSNFFQGMSYTSFQKLADTYVQMSPVQSTHPTVLPTAPELVKLAFTLDFTARVASLSKQNIGHITGLGTRYLDERFQYKQACTDHPWSDCDDAND